MMEIQNRKKPIAGYMGYVPSKQETEATEQITLSSHIPGYVGYIPAMKSQNLYAKTFGKITQNCSKKTYEKGIEHPATIKYTSTMKEAYMNPNKIKRQEEAEGKLNGVKLETFSTAAKLMFSASNFKQTIKDQLDQATTLTYEEARVKAFE